jgi:threonine synthase
VKFCSARGSTANFIISEAMLRGLADDGGLFVPESLPEINPEAFSRLEAFPEIAAAALAPFFSGDPLADQLPEICAAAFNFPLPLKAMRDGTGLLELFHGPTCAFKDFGARFLAECFARLEAGKKRTILVATSGDTGGAVASAFHGRPGIEVGILYPDGGVSARQEMQLTAWGGNVRAFAVAGTFDDCQRMVKEAFADRTWRAARGLTSANSINIGRLLPQIAYFGAASLWHERRTGEKPSFIIPAGNLGNGLGAFYAKRMGFPIGQIALASNANRTIPDFFSTGNYQPRPSTPTLANAMDVGAPSNLERLRDLYPDINELRRDAIAMSVDDAQIREAILRAQSHWGEIICPHTATAFHVRKQLPEPHWIIAATAHPAKFEGLLEPLLGRPVPVPPQLAELLGRPGRSEKIGATLVELQRAWGRP